MLVHAKRFALGYFFHLGFQKEVVLNEGASKEGGGFSLPPSPSPEMPEKRIKGAD